MKKIFIALTSLMMFCATHSALAADEYNAVPAGDAQYKQCKSYAAKLGWEGGEEKSPIAGQNKVEAFCTCMWNETPEDFKGNLATFSESEKGKKTNKICEKYSNWQG